MAMRKFIATAFARRTGGVPATPPNLRARSRPARNQERPAPGDNPVSTASRAWKLAGLAAITAIAAIAYTSGALRPVDAALAQLRFLLTERAPSQSLTVVEIDVASLRAAQTWPWSRERFARAIDHLAAAGAEVVAFDVDFSARSGDAADKALEASLARHAGSVILPTFVQVVAADGAHRLEGTNPLADLADHAVLASVNVPVDPDGEVRRYHHGFIDAGGDRPSMAATLAGAPPGRTGAFLIDYGVRVRDIDRISFEDAYTGRFDPALVRGRKILVGATAVELGDEFVTPKGTMPGVYVHALAYESLAAGRALVPLQPALLVILAGAAAVFLRPRRRLQLSTLLRRHALVAGAAVLVPLAAQVVAPVSLDAGPILMAQALCLLWTTRAELKRRARAVVEAREAHLVQLATHMRKSRNRVRAANRKLQTANEALDRALHAKSAFLAATSHEIRTPLNAILGMSQVLLADRSLAPGVRDKIATVRTAGEAMQALVSDILDVAQMETGDLAVAPVEIDLRKLLAETARTWSANAQARGLAFRLDDRHAPARIVEDPTRLRQILAVLLSNAVKFTDQGEVVLSIDVVAGAAGERLVLTVSDTGPGMPDDQFEAIFEPFHQVDSSVTRKHEGAGLGLAICRRVAQAMGGEVTVTSELGRGSAFTVRLPLTRIEEAMPDPSTAAAGLVAASVLVIDANPLFQKILQATLADHVARLDTAATMEAALAAMGVQHFDLIVAEGQTLAQDGPATEALGRLAAGAAGAWTCLLWSGAPDDIPGLLAAGADQVIRKPISPADLLAELRRTGSRPRAKEASPAPRSSAAGPR